jgi:hypothetical protein
LDHSVQSATQYFVTDSVISHGDEFRLPTDHTAKSAMTAAAVANFHEAIALKNSNEFAKCAF